MKPTRLGATAALLTSTLLGACAPARAGNAAASPPYGHAAPALVPGLSLLRTVGIPVYVPDRLPPPPTGEAYAPYVQGAPGSYRITLRVTPVGQVTGLGGVGVGSAPAAAILRGGRSGLLVAHVRGLATFHGPGQAITLPNGTTLTFYRDQGAAWVVHGWHYAMLDTAHPPATPAAAIRLMNRLDRAVGSAGNPIGQGTSGWAVEVDGSAGTQSRVVWTHGPVAYEIDGLLVSAITLARNWVEVST